MEDSQIIELYWQKNSRAITASEEQYGVYCRSIAEAILHSREDAEECVNDTWLRAWNAIPPQRPKSLKLFLARITRNLAFNRWNEQSAEKRGGGETPLVLDELSECLQSETDVEGEVLTRELQACIRSFVRALPGRERRIFVLRYYFTESIAAIAERCSVSEGNVKVILSRTRKKLRKRLIKEGFFNESN
ncbi:MAG: RNA polymerase sigma factor [Oscillospiraceae bacterium]|nr:RNA polymerase sigma factor [Oscillospiraceae bacterium]